MTKIIVTAFIAAFLLALTGSVALAEGDPAAGEKVFKKCKTCHTVVEGKKKAQGPNLLGVVGRPAGSTEFKYSKSMKAAAEKGLVWDESNMNDYVKDPKKFLKAYLGAKKVKNKMVFKLKNDKQRANVIAYLKSLSE